MTNSASVFIKCKSNPTFLEYLTDWINYLAQNLCMEAIYGVLVGSLSYGNPAHSWTNVTADEYNFTDASYPIFYFSADLAINYKKANTVISHAGNGNSGGSHLLQNSTK